LVEHLTGPEKDLRQVAVTEVRDAVIPEVQALVIDRLLEFLRNGPEGLRDRAADSLVDLATVSVPFLVFRLTNDRNAAFQLRLIDTLSRIAKTLTGECGSLLHCFMLIASTQARSPEVRSAFGRVLDEMWCRFVDCRQAEGLEDQNHDHGVAKASLRPNGPCAWAAVP
jgi:hypothetical protein